jgi:hypothetical protein
MGCRKYSYIYIEGERLDTEFDTLCLTLCIPGIPVFQVFRVRDESERLRRVCVTRECSRVSNSENEKIQKDFSDLKYEYSRN